MEDRDRVRGKLIMRRPVLSWIVMAHACCLHESVGGGFIRHALSGSMNRTPTSSRNGSQPKGFKVFIKRDGRDSGEFVFYEDIRKCIYKRDLSVPGEKIE